MQVFKSNKEAPTSQKIRGGYYTPRTLADYICRWAIRSRSDRMIEPSCGDGGFVSAAVPLLGKKGLITAVEIVPREIEKAKEALNGASVPVEWKTWNLEAALDHGDDVLLRRGCGLSKTDVRRARDGWDRLRQRRQRRRQGARMAA